MLLVAAAWVAPPTRAAGSDSLSATATATATATASAPTSTSSALDRPFVPGGYDDKPHLTGLFGRIAIGGYAEAHATWERADGATEEAGFLLKRWNLLAASKVGDHVQMWAEVEFEDGGNEIVLELAQLDLELHPVANLRGGMLLVPIGRFNLAHDGPRNAFTDRPLLATDLLGSALSMPGFGAFGRVATGAESRITYEAYAVNGYHDGLLLASPDGTRLPEGRRNLEDGNASPAAVGRVAWNPGERHEVGLSGYAGAWNRFRIDGLDVDERRSVRIGVLDARTEFLGLAWNGEVAAISIDIPPTLTGLFASRQAGFFAEVTRPFARGFLRSMPAAFLSAGARLEGVDFDRDLAGDSHVAVTTGVHFHPSNDSVLKLDYQRGRRRDRFDNASEGAAVKLCLTSYF
jgi:hypothetical protein